jgi:hypothetical protein
MSWCSAHSSSRFHQYSWPLCEAELRGHQEGLRLLL